MAEQVLRLFVIDATALSMVAHRNITRICTSHPEYQCKIEVVDLQQHPEMAKREQISALPALKKKGVGREPVLVGDLSREEDVLRWLGHGR